MVHVRQSNNTAVEQPFCINYRVGGPADMRSAYLFADRPTAASYTPAIMWNGNRGAATITRLGTGHYQVTIPGLGVSTSGEYGNVQVSHAQINGDGRALRATVQAWVHRNNDLDVWVYVFDSTGTGVDQGFVLSYHEKAAPIAGDQGSGAHVLATNLTAVSYVPDGAYTDSNGTAGPRFAETITRVGTGVYDVLLPSVVHVGSTHAQVTAFGAGNGQQEHATIESWGQNAAGRTVVRVLTFDAAGVPAPALFSLSYLTNRPARNAATNAVVGLGCHGPVLRALSRPIAGTNWTFELTGLPASSLFGFMQLGLSNPNLPLGFIGAPECVRLQDVLATHLLFLPIGNPAYSLPISTSASFLGLNIYVQGGALAPGVNALGLAASNGIRGVLGNN